MGLTRVENLFSTTLIRYRASRTNRTSQRLDVMLEERMSTNAATTKKKKLT